MIYFLIFFAKVLEIALGTLRLIVVSNGKKWLGAILQLVTSIVWLFSTGAVLIGIEKDLLKIVFFILGNFVGSYVGSLIEEKLAIGSNMITCIVDCNNKKLMDTIRNNDFALTVLHGEGKDQQKDIFLIMTSRKKRHKVVDIIKKESCNSVIISENAVPVSGGYST